MRIDAALYQQLIEDFITKVWDDELTEEQKLIHPRGHSSTWDIEEVGINGYNFFESFFLEHYPKTERNHFTRKLLQYDGDTIPIKDDFLCVMLEFIGIQLTNNTPKRVEKDARQKAAVLYKIYQERFSQGDTKRDDEIKYEHSYFMPLNDDEIQLKKLLSNLFKGLIEKDDLKVYKCWEDRSWNSARSFYLFQEPLDLVNYYCSSIQSFEQRGRIKHAKCYVTVIDRLKRFESKELAVCRKLSLKNLDTFITNLQSIKRTIDADERYWWMDDITILQLLNHDLSELITTCPEELKRRATNLFPNKKLSPHQTHYEFKFIYEDNWLIRSCERIGSNILNRNEENVQYRRDENTIFWLINKAEHITTSDSRAALSNKESFEWYTAQESARLKEWTSHHRELLDQIGTEDE
ncbi:hypothetical protein ABDD95_18665 [Mucilaginibacter sp. PAMB04274]|uniref:hypothetical protein n=1 Tax=Mucilaginibacter sp. PAMB04274 TaxID=3138568 RepID=UPI0031F6F79A